MNIIALSLAHCDVVAYLHEQGFSEVWSAQSFADLIGMPASFGFIATINDEPAGFILCQGDRMEAEIISIATSSVHRRMGVATTLLNKCCAVTARLFLEVAEDNSGAILFYEKHDFKQVGRRNKYYKRMDQPNVDAFVMEKKTE